MFSSTSKCKCPCKLLNCYFFVDETFYVIWKLLRLRVWSGLWNCATLWDLALLVICDLKLVELKNITIDKNWKSRYLKRRVEHKAPKKSWNDVKTIGTWRFNSWLNIWFQIIRIFPHVFLFGIVCACEWKVATYMGASLLIIITLASSHDLIFSCMDS